MPGQSRVSGLLSPTAINTYRQCPYKYYLMYVEEAPSIRPYAPEALDMGRIVHETIKHYYQTIPSNVTKTEIKLWLSKALGETLTPEYTAYRDRIEYLLLNFAKFEQQRLSWHINPRPVAVEQDYKREPFHGIVDALFHDKNDQYVVVDWKTGYGRNPYLTEDMMIQGAIYAYLTGARRVYFVFLQWGDVRELRDFDTPLKLALKVAEDIKRGEYPSKWFSEACRTCPYQLRCFFEHNQMTMWEV